MWALRAARAIGPRSPGVLRVCGRGQARAAGTINAVYRPSPPSTPSPRVAAACSQSPCPCDDADHKQAVLASHQAAWTKEDVQDAHEKHLLFTWNNYNAASKNALQVVRSEGCYFWDADGHRYLDFNSMAMCSGHGHTPDPSVINAIMEQLTTLPYSYPGISVTPIQARLGKLLSEVFPGDINTFFFPSSGAEAVEAAIRMARRMTGRHKIMSRYRSYHGATMGALSATGDFRRFPVDSSTTGFIKFMDPYPYGYALGDTEEEITERSLAILRDQVDAEGGQNIAAILMESITGTNGVLKPPKGYLEGVREICDEHGIVMVMDEVMAGFGRSGKLFGFCHAPDMIPDIVTFAKQVNGAFVPLGGVGIRDHVANHFRENNVTIGSTYHSHPVALASAYAAVQHFINSGMLQNVQAMGPHLEAGLQYLMDNHPSIKQARCVGLFAAFDVQKDSKGTFIAKVTEASPVMGAFRQALLANGLFTMMRGHTVFCNPPMIITKPEIDEAIEAFDKCLPILDDAMEA